MGWMASLNGHEFEQTLRHGKGQGSLAYCSLWDHEESNVTWWVTEQQQQRKDLPLLLKSKEMPVQWISPLLPVMGIAV